MNNRLCSLIQEYYAAALWELFKQRIISLQPDIYQIMLEVFIMDATYIKQISIYMSIYALNNQGSQSTSFEQY